MYQQKSKLGEKIRRTHFKTSRARGRVEKSLHREVVQALNTALEKHNLDLDEGLLNSNQTKCVFVSVCYRMGAPHSTINSWIPAGCPTIQLNSGTIYAEIASDYQVKVSVPQDCPPLQLPIQFQIVTCASYILAVDGRFQQSPSWVQLFC